MALSTRRAAELKIQSNAPRHPFASKISPPVFLLYFFASKIEERCDSSALEPVDSSLFPKRAKLGNKRSRTKGDGA